MGKGAVEDGGALYEACSECRVVCQATHGKDLPHAVPRFFKRIVEHSTPSSTNCHLQVPASFIRNHIGLSKKETYVLVAAQGCEWNMTFNTIGFKTGWKEFSIAYQLETGDGIMLSLAAPKRFYANVFDKFGMEKFHTKQVRSGRASLTSMRNSMNGGQGAEDQHMPLGTQVHPEGISNGTHHHQTAGTSGQNGNHENRILFKDEHHLFPDEPVDHDADPSSMSPSSEDSEDSIQVRLAKSVLAKARRKKSKRKLKTSCTSTLQAAAAAEGGTLTPREDAIVGFEACQNDDGRADRRSNVDPIQNDDRADGRNNVDPINSPRRNDDGTPASVDDAMFENPCEELRGLADVRASWMVVGGIEVSNVEEVNNLQAESQPGKQLQQKEVEVEEKEKKEEEAPLPQTAIAEGVPLRRTESDNPAAAAAAAEDAPSPLFTPGLVKRELDMSPHQTSGNCNHCGKRKEALKLVDGSTPPKSEPVTTDSPGLDVRTPEARSPTLNAPRVTESQKQRALSIATELSKTIQNPNALVVGRVSMSAPHGCFLSNMCSEMLPCVPTELTLMGTEGHAHRVNWKPNQRIIDGPGWKDFVGSHNLHADDFWVMEVVDSSENNVVVKAHIFHSHEMELSLEQRQPPPVAAPQAAAAPVPVPAVVPAKTPPAAVLLPVTSPAFFPVLGTPASVLGNRAKTRSSHQLRNNSLASPFRTTNKRTRAAAAAAANVDESAAGSPRDLEFTTVCATNSTEYDQHLALLEITRPSPMKRLRRGSSSSPSTPRRGTDSIPTSGTGEEPSQAAAKTTPAKLTKTPAKSAPKPAAARKAKQQAGRRHSLYTPRGRKRKAMAEAAAVVAAGCSRRGRGASTQSARKVQLRSSSSTTTAAAAAETATVEAEAGERRAENPRQQVRTRHSQKTHYTVSKVIDRRKSLQGVVFLVELLDRVRPPEGLLPKRMKAQQDEKGRWWVPDHHFNHNLTACYLE